MDIFMRKIRRGSIVLAWTCLVMDLTGFSTTLEVGRNSAATPATPSRLAESFEHVHKCPNGLVPNSARDICDPEAHSNLTRHLISSGRARNRHGPAAEMRTVATRQQSRAALSSAKRPSVLRTHWLPSPWCALGDV